MGFTLKICPVFGVHFTQRLPRRKVAKPQLTSDTQKNYEIHEVSRNFLWRRHPDLNWGIKVLQTSALPLGYVAGLARVAGFEPANDGIRIRCLTAWRYPNDYNGVGSGIRTHVYRSHNPGS